MTESEHDTEVQANGNGVAGPFPTTRRAMLKGTGAAVGTAMLATPALAEDIEEADEQTLQEAAIAGSRAAAMYSSPLMTLYGGHRLGGWAADQLSWDTNNQLHWSAYGTGATQQDRFERLLVESRSHIDSTIAVAHSEAKIAGFESLNEGKDKGTANSRAQSAVDDFYTQLQKSVIYRQDNAIQQLRVLEQDRIEAGIDETDFYRFRRPTSNTDMTDFPGGQNGDWDSGGFRDSNIAAEGQIIFYQQTFSAYNGDEIEVTNAVANFYGDFTAGTYTGDTHFADYGPDVGFAGDGGDSFGLTITHPDDSSDTVQVAAPRFVRHLLDYLDSVRSEALDNVQTIINDLYAAYDAGDVDPDDLINSTDRIHMMVEDFEESGAEIAPHAIAHEGGYATTASGSIEVEYTPYEGSNDDEERDLNEDESEVLWGSLFASDASAFGESLDKGDVYETDGMDATIWFLERTGSGQVHQHELDGQIEVVTIEDNEGEEIESTSVHDNEFSTSDTEDLQAQIDALEEARENQNEQIEATIELGGGGGLPGMSGIPAWAWLVPGVALVIAIFVAISGDNRR